MSTGTIANVLTISYIFILIYLNFEPSILWRFISVFEKRIAMRCFLTMNRNISVFRYYCPALVSKGIEGIECF
jgi:hypothetical protein